ncbi:MAG: hypothetical protein IPH11_08790 [Ignavibacteriales bacterium]|nr:hypothetical protein [Ignavibacteriales bacterium]
MFATAGLFFVCFGGGIYKLAGVVASVCFIGGCSVGGAKDNLESYVTHKLNFQEFSLVKHGDLVPLCLNFLLILLPQSHAGTKKSQSP